VAVLSLPPGFNPSYRGIGLWRFSKSVFQAFFSMSQSFLSWNWPLKTILRSWRVTKPDVSILLIVELAFEGGNAGAIPTPDVVSILLIVELAFEARGGRRIYNADARVSILLIVELAFEAEILRDCGEPIPLFQSFLSWNWPLKNYFTQQFKTNGWFQSFLSWNWPLKAPAGWSCCAWRMWFQSFLSWNWLLKGYGE